MHNRTIEYALTIYRVYTITPKGNTRLVYAGESEDAALKAYNRLVERRRPRLLNRGYNCSLGVDIMSWNFHETRKVDHD